MKMLTKKCCRCTKVKSIDDFHRAARSLCGVHSICKACKKIYMLNYSAVGKLKISKDKYRRSEKGTAKIREYTASEANKVIQKSYRNTPSGKACAVAKLAKYRAILLLAMPDWVDVKEMKAIYKNCSNKLEVDHIIPLQGDTISGLHVPWNTQYLTRAENAKKSNSFDGTYNNESWRRA